MLCGMRVMAGDVTDEVLDALFNKPPGFEDSGRESWRQALAAAITVWENLQGDDDAHPHVHQQVPQGIQHRTPGVGSTTETIVLQGCPGCGAVSSATLDGRWGWEQVMAAAGLSSSESPPV